MVATQAPYCHPNLHTSSPCASAPLEPPTLDTGHLPGGHDASRSWFHSVHHLAFRFNPRPRPPQPQRREAVMHRSHLYPSGEWPVASQCLLDFSVLPYQSEGPLQTANSKSDYDSDPPQAREPGPVQRQSLLPPAGLRDMPEVQASAALSRTSPTVALALALCSLFNGTFCPRVRGYRRRHGPPPPRRPGASNLLKLPVR